MANIVETDNWPGGVYQYADGDVLEGGPDSSEVLPLKQLAQRSLYQRLRNVTDWDAGLAAAFWYPAGAVVRHAGVSWRAKEGNAVEPGTDATKWERWGYTESELATVMGRSYVRFQGAVPPAGSVPSVAVPGTGVYTRLLLPLQINASPDFIVDQVNNTITLVKAGLYMITSDCAANTADTTKVVNSQTVLRVSGVVDYLNRGVHVQGANGYPQWTNSIKGEVWISAGSVIDICGWNAPGNAATAQFIYDLMVTRAVTSH